MGIAEDAPGPSSHDDHSCGQRIHAGIFPVSIRHTAARAVALLNTSSNPMAQNAPARGLVR